MDEMDKFMFPEIFHSKEDMEALQRGHSDCKNGVSLEDNPFEAGTDESQLWHSGWISAKMLGNETKGIGSYNMNDHDILSLREEYKKLTTEMEENVDLIESIISDPALNLNDKQKEGLANTIDLLYEMEQSIAAFILIVSILKR